MSQAKTVSIYGCGGFGTETLLRLLGREIYQLMVDHVALYALDTSKSNLKAVTEVEGGEAIQQILVPNADGSGKDRRQNYPAIQALVKKLVNDGVEVGTHIVVSSGSGGSGAVTATELAQELTNRGRSVILMILGTDDSITDVENVLKTIKTVQHKASLGKADYAVFYDSNRGPDGKVNSRAADEAFLSVISDLLVIGSPDVHGLDTQDVQNWLNPPAFRDDQGVMRILNVVSRKVGADFEHGDVPTSSLSLVSSRGIDPQTAPGVVFNTGGYLGKEVNFQNEIEEVQFQLFAGKSAKLVNLLEGRLNEYNTLSTKAKAATAGDELKRKDTDEVTDTGTFL